MKTFITTNPADLAINPKLHHALTLDWLKVPRILSGDWPRPLPPRHTFTGGESSWFQQAMSSPYWVVDTEYIVGQPGVPSRLTLIGGYYPGAPYALQYWWGTSPELDRKWMFWFAMAIQGIPTAYWNAVADIPVIHANVYTTQSLLEVHGWHKRVEDPMLIHALLYSEWPHTLEYATSTHGEHVKVKHKMADDLAEYHCGDLAETCALHGKYSEMINGDKGSKEVYEGQALKLIPIILNSSHIRGIRIDRQAIVVAISDYQMLVNEAFSLARVACGYAINLRSGDQVKEYLYTIAKYPVQKGRTVSGQSSDGDAINTLRQSVLPFDADYEMSEGLSLEYVLGRIDQGADMFLEAQALHSYAFATMNTYLYGLCKGVYDAATDSGKKKQRELLRASAVTEEMVCERVYPDVKQHTQANGRWSWTDPPMTGVPKSLHHIFIPDEGTAWLIYDYKRMEPTIDAYLCGDEPTIKAIEEGRDIYKEGTIETFGRYSDPLKKVFKAVKLSLSYGKRPDYLHKIPNIMNYGMTKQQLTQSAHNYLNAHPQKRDWMARKKASIKATQGSRTVLGRYRWLMGHASDAEKEGLNHEMQALATDITNLTIIKIANAAPYSYVVNNRFDEMWWAVPLNKVAEMRQIIIDKVKEPWLIGGRQVVFQIDPPNCEVKEVPK